METKVKTTANVLTVLMSIGAIWYIVQTLIIVSTQIF